MGDEQELCRTACEQFSQGDFSAAESSLRSLEEKKSDWRTDLNKGIVAFCSSRQTKLDELILEMNKICDQLQIKLEVGNSPAKLQQDGTTLCLYYNYALTLFLGCQYTAAQCVAERLLPFCEPYDDVLSLKIAFLAIHLHLVRGFSEKALNLIAQIEGAQPTSSDAQGGNPEEQLLNSSWIKNKLCLFKAYALLTGGSMKSSKKEMKLLASNLTSKPSQEFANYTGYMVAWMKCYFEYMRGNGKKTLKLLNAVGDSLESTELPFNENIAVPGFNHSAAQSIARACALFQLRRFNSAAVNLIEAWDFLDKFCREAPTVNGALSLRTLSFAGPAYSAVGYNMACCLLHAGLYRAAFDCFISILPGVKQMPQVWLHVAECCIQLHEAGKQSPHSGTSRLSIVGNSFGNGLHRKIAVNSNFLQGSTDTTSESSQQPQQPSLEFANACLNNCIMLITMYRANTGSSVKTSVSTDDTSSKIPFSSGLPAVSLESLETVHAHALLSAIYVSICLNNFNMAIRNGNQLIGLGTKLSPVVKYLCHLYMAEAYVNVDRIADAISSLSAGNLAQDFSSPSFHNGLATGRASVSSSSGTPREKSVEAEGGHFQSSSSASLPQTSATTFWPSSQAAAQAVILYNLAVAYATRGNFDRAKINLETAMSSIPEPWPAYFYHLAFYLTLCDTANTSAGRALELVRKHYPHVTPNR